MTHVASATLRNVNLLVSDVARAQHFCERAFGLRTDPRRSALPHMLILGAAGCTLSLKAAQTEDPARRDGPGPVELASETNDVEAVHVALTELGAPVEDQGSGRTFDARNLDGHHLVVYGLTAMTPSRTRAWGWAWVPPVPCPPLSFGNSHGLGMG